MRLAEAHRGNRWFWPALRATGGMAMTFLGDRKPQSTPLVAAGAGQGVVLAAFRSRRRHDASDGD